MNLLRFDCSADYKPMQALGGFRGRKFSDSVRSRAQPKRNPELPTVLKYRFNLNTFELSPVSFRRKPVKIKYFPLVEYPQDSPKTPKQLKRKSIGANWKEAPSAKRRGRPKSRNSVYGSLSPSGKANTPDIRTTGISKKASYTIKNLSLY